MLESKLDLLLLVLPFDLTNVDTMPLLKEYFKLAYRKGTNIINPSNYKISKLDAGNILLMEGGHFLQEHTLSACRIRRQDKANKFSANSLFTLVQMVDDNLGISYLTEIVLRGGLLKNTNVVVAGLSKQSYRTISLAW